MNRPTVTMNSGRSHPPALMAWLLAIAILGLVGMVFVWLYVPSPMKYGCKEGYMKGEDGQCDSCAKGFERGPIDEKNPSKIAPCVPICDTGYLLDKDKKCTVCADGYQPKLVGSDKKCVVTDCKDGYIRDSKKECKRCAQGYVKEITANGETGNCIRGECNTGYLRDIEGGCTDCAPNYVLDETTGECVLKKAPQSRSVRFANTYN
jgi:hypothetical protein